MSYSSGPNAGLQVTLRDGRKAVILRPAGDHRQPDERGWYVVRVLGEKGSRIEDLRGLIK